MCVCVFSFQKMKNALWEIIRRNPFRPEFRFRQLEILMDEWICWCMQSILGKRISIYYCQRFNRQLIFTILMKQCYFWNTYNRIHLLCFCSGSTLAQELVNKWNFRTKHSNASKCIHFSYIKFGKPIKKRYSGGIRVLLLVSHIFFFPRHY